MTARRRPAMSDEPRQPVDMSQPQGDGPVWGMASEDLNATLLSWRPGDGVADHVNPDRDVLILVTAGSGLATVDGEEHALAPPHLLLIRKHAHRRIVAGADGLRYLSVHRRRGPLQIDASPPDRRG
jgi:quercetin dioxygenase-like cupin family protein